jgi:polyferredoxin
MATTALSTIPKIRHSYTKALLIAQISIYVLIILHSITWHVFGIHVVSKLCPFVLGDQVANLELNWSAVFWLLAFGSALVFGRAFCAWGCMFGAFQDFMSGVGARLQLKRTKNRWGVWLTGFVTFSIVVTKIFGSRHDHWSSLFQHLSVVALGGVVLWLLVERPHSPPEVRTLPKYLHASHYLGAIAVTWISTDVFRTGITLVVDKYGILNHMVWPFVAAEAVLITTVVLLVEKRAFCKYACPIGLFFRFFAAMPFPTKYRITASGQQCNQCGKCDRVCRVDITPMSDLLQFGKVQDPNCVNCLECVSHCPKAAIEFSRGRRAPQPLL